ncbi:hypothetical protein Nepgr_016894 [Nepenthes gracilis]|uniref:Choline transporter-like protein n=1 Tax=Nepenthes gracilis TaxID=150966 RepID=A0AAD3SPE2_NEPGR|nr:hypothetical protein Nepgr_016894 [Nepenthes gracilis]
MFVFEDEKDLTLIGLVGLLDPPREEVQDAMLSCLNAGIFVIIVTEDNKATAESFCCKIGAFDHLDDFVGYSYTASEFEELPTLQKTIALQHLALFMRVEPSLPVFATTKQLVRYSLGSVALGSLALSFIESICFIFESIRRTREQEAANDRSRKPDALITSNSHLSVSDLLNYINPSSADHGRNSTTSSEVNETDEYVLATDEASLLLQVLSLIF